MTSAEAVPRHWQRHEQNNVLKVAYKLNEKTLSPDNLERQKVTLALNVFDRSTAQGVKTVGQQLTEIGIDWHGTAVFLAEVYKLSCR